MLERGTGELEAILHGEVMRLPRMTTRRWLLAVAVAAVIAAGVDCSVIGMALLILIRAARWPRPVHRTTAIFLTLLTGVLLWANPRRSGWEEFGGTPMELDPITKEMFWRGWPLSPCMICEYRQMRFHPSGIEGCVLVFDGALFLAALFAAKAMCERCLTVAATLSPLNPSCLGRSSPGGCRELSRVIQC